MASLMVQLLAALRERPMRVGYVLMALVLSVVLFSLADVLPAPYDLHH